MNHNATVSMALALAVSDLGVASAEIAWALSSGETGITFYARVNEALRIVQRAQGHLVRAAATETQK